MGNLEKLCHAPWVQENVDLLEYTTFKLGGPAEFFIEVKNTEMLTKAINWAKENGLKTYFLGGGSNLLINDKGVHGLVIKLANNTINIRGERVECGAGLLLANAVSTSTGNSLSGLEWSVGIPRATIGGAVRGNAGAFGSVICEIVETVEVYDTKKLTFKIFSNKDCKFSYRTSIFKESHRYVIWKVVLKMSKKNVNEIKSRIEEVFSFRTKHYPKLPSAGSIFENLTKKVIKQANLNLYEQALRDGKLKGEKIGAGYVIDKCGLKGKKIGKIKVSLEHANHIVNTGSGTAEEVVMLISYIKQQVRDKFGILLKEEIQYLGFDF